MSVIRVTSLLFVIDRPPQLLQNPPVLNSYFGLDSGTYFRGGGWVIAMGDFVCFCRHAVVWG
jgi:hypothetical protein